MLSMPRLTSRLAGWDPALKYALGLYLFLRITLSLWGATVLSVSAAPTGPDEVLRPYQGVAPISEGWGGFLLGPWQRFDTLWYLRIAEQGYSAQDGSLVYFPLYPLLIRVLGALLGGNLMLAALLISNLAFVGSLYFFYKLALKEVGEESGKRATQYLSLFPTAFFFLAGYTESLFLLLTIVAFYSAKRGKWVLVGACGFLASLTRLQGFLLFLPPLYLAWQSQSKAKNILPLLAIPLGTLLFIGYGFLAFQVNILEVYEGSLYAQFVTPWENIWGGIIILFTPQGSFIDLLNLILTFLFLALTALCFLRLPREYGIYIAAILLALLLRRTTIQPLVSMSRYALTLFPAFMLWGIWGRNPWIHRLILYPSVALLLYLAGQFFLWGWVA